MWRIRSLTQKDNKGNPKYWSEDVGWTWKDFADTFTTEEKEKGATGNVVQPVDSVWEEEVE